MKDNSSVLASIASRTGLLVQAIDLCSSLNAVLELIGPSRFIKSLAVDCPDTLGDGGDSLRELSKLDDSLHRSLQSISEVRNLVLAPVLRLPDDVLRDIFSIRQPHEYQSVEDHKWPLNISLVCRRWRAVALHTAPLWAFLELPSTPWRCRIHDQFELEESTDVYPWYDYTRQERISRVLDARLALSKRALLTVSVRLLESSLISAIAGSFVSSCTNRVSDLDIDARRHHKGVKVIMPCLSATCLVLKRLNIRVAGRDGPELLLAADQLFKTEMPCLTELVLDSLPLPQDTHNPYLALSVCRKLELTAPDNATYSLDDLRRLLESCTQVTQLHLHAQREQPQIEVVSALGSPSSPKGRVSMLNLKSLILTGRRWIALPASLMYAPSLDHFELGRNASPNLIPADTFSAVLEFLKASSAPIKSLVTVGLEASNLEAILHLVPSIRSLTYIPPGWQSMPHITVLRCLNNPVSSRSTGLVPFLERLVFPCWEMLPEMHFYHELLDFVHHRASKAVPLLSPIRQLELRCSEAMPSSPEETRQQEEQLADEVEDLIVWERAWENAIGWRYDKKTRAWERYRKHRDIIGIR